MDRLIITIQSINHQ